MKLFSPAILTLALFSTSNLHAERIPEMQTEAGRKLFARHCSECHGPQGEGTDRAPAIVTFVKTADRASLETFIKNGNLRKGMPSWSRLPDQRLDQIVAYLKSLDSRDNPAR